MSRTFLLLHGLPGHGDQWAQHREHLQPNRVLTPTFAGFAPGTRGNSFPSTAEHARQIVEWSADVPAQNLVVVAWSFACQPLLFAMTELGLRPGCAILYDPSSDSFLEQGPRARHQESAVAAFGDVFAALGQADDAQLIEALFRATGDDETLASLSAKQRGLFVAGATAVRAAFAPGSGAAGIPAASLRELRGGSVIVARGERSREFFGISAQAVAELVPGAELRTISAADHIWPLTRPREFSEFVRDVADEAANS